MHHCNELCNKNKENMLKVQKLKMNIQYICYTFVHNQIMNVSLQKHVYLLLSQMLIFKYKKHISYYRKISRTIRTRA